MKCGTGSLTLAWALAMVLLGSSQAKQAARTHAAGSPCKLRERTDLSQHQVAESLTRFDQANGHNLGTWPPGFPELHVHKDSTLNGSQVQCSLAFMISGLTLILKDQDENLNPSNHELHSTLSHAIHGVKLLSSCAKVVLGGGCPTKPPPPSMPTQTFERKQWGHTLLRAAKGYLAWMKNQVVARHRHAIRPTLSRPKTRKYFEGSGHFF